jgi:hypothetical protein
MIYFYFDFSAFQLKKSADLSFRNLFPEFGHRISTRWLQHTENRADIETLPQIIALVVTIDRKPLWSMPNLEKYCTVLPEKNSSIKYDGRPSIARGKN